MALLGLITLAFGIFLLSYELASKPSVKTKAKYSNLLAVSLIVLGIIELMTPAPEPAVTQSFHTLPPTAAQLILVSTKLIQLYVF